jgi:hypothetical protein
VGEERRKQGSKPCQFLGREGGKEEGREEGRREAKKEEENKIRKGELRKEGKKKDMRK